MSRIVDSKICIAMGLQSKVRISEIIVTVHSNKRQEISCQYPIESNGRALFTKDICMINTSRKI